MASRLQNASSKAWTYVHTHTQMDNPTTMLPDGRSSVKFSLLRAYVTKTTEGWLPSVLISLKHSYTLHWPKCQAHEPIHRATVTKFRSVSMPAGFRGHLVGKTLEKRLPLWYRLNTLRWLCNDHTDIFVNQKVDFYFNNMINLRPLTPHIRPCYTHKMARSYDGHRYCDVTSLYALQIWSTALWPSRLPSVLWRCWLGGRNGIRPVKNWVVWYWHGYLSGARCRLAYR